MLEQTDKKDKLYEAIQLCSIHSERMVFAGEKLKKHFPLDQDSYFAAATRRVKFFRPIDFSFFKITRQYGQPTFPCNSP